MRGWRGRLHYVWTDHRDGIVGGMLAVAICGGLFGAIAWLSHPDLRAPLLEPAIVSPTDGTIIGFLGGDSKYGTGIRAYVRTSTNAYVTVRAPNFSGCHEGDRIFLAERRSGGRSTFSLREPGCARAGRRAGVGGGGTG